MNSSERTIRRCLSRNEDSRDELYVHFLGSFLPAPVHAGLRRGRQFRSWCSHWDRECELQRVLSGRSSGHGQFCNRLEYLVVVFPRPRQRHLLRNADLSHAPQRIPARKGPLQRPHRRSSGCPHPRRRPSAARHSRPMAEITAASRGDGHRHGGLVFLLCDLCFENPPQRHF